ncbi:MAG: hypothetical protein MPK62_06060 [Alphaproteobacteria bacterium]|nr:hypothetical protein [Nitrosopumilus sp.]MDA8030685.1 hypothetical protein [Alphaproteobacteria bacterium]
MGARKRIRRVQPQRGSLYVNIPYRFAADLGIEKGQYLEFRVADGMMVVRPLPGFPARHPEGGQDGRADPPDDGSGTMAVVDFEKLEEYLDSRIVHLISIVDRRQDD